jgi:hypothetical protein
MGRIESCEIDKGPRAAEALRPYSDHSDVAVVVQGFGTEAGSGRDLKNYTQAVYPTDSGFSVDISGCVQSQAAVWTIAVIAASERM